MQHINRLFAFIVPLLSNFRCISLDCYSEIAGISMMRAEACPNCNGGGIIERTFSEDYPTYTNCRHGGTGTYDVMYVTYKIHSYDCNKCNYRRILSQEITGSKTQCLLTGEVY